MSTPSAAAARPTTPVGTRATAQQLKERGVPVESPSERLRGEVFRRLDLVRRQGLSREEATATLFPKTVLPSETYEDLTTALVAGSHVLFFGPSGAGKTNLAKEVWDLFPKDAWVVAGCPVLDHPLSIVDPKVAERFPPCPICRRRFSPGNEVAAFDPVSADPAKVPAELVRLREGYGFARLQGSSEVFPDHLTGNINLRRLEEIGDPMSPLVLEPGKLLQANRGLLLVDEIGKLPLGTQNVLLQALQEGTVTPSKSRESFPGMFLAVGTSNLSDLDNINDPLSDRLTSLHVTYNPAHAANRRIVQLASFPEGASYVPEILVDAGVRVIETWRQKASDDNPDIGEVGSNRTLIDVVARTAATASLHDHPVAGVEDVQAGLLHAMRGRIRARSGDSFDQNERRVREFVGQHLEPALKRSGGVYWCRFFRSALKENQADGESVVSEGRRLKNDPALIDTLAAPGTEFPKFRAFTAYVGERGRRPPGLRAVDAAVRTFELLERYSLFQCADEDADDDARL
ncbi:MAG TPA: sigma 54-interacting transcriptional regulator [Thermoplasmata archaeon]|nr:sigma 54-interacting transcriptional regulator [Thermoplasmata archaeon]